ncbi:MAG: response regulator [Firmicutes bacterium]|nr:response regulator [Bacillota bacterium]
MNILTVDDIVVARKMVARAAKSLDADVFEAGNGEEALEVLKETRGAIDLIFLDWNMPKMSGIDFLAHIKKHPEYKNIPVIMTTSVNERENIIKAIQAGASQYLVKPFTSEDVIKKILEHIDVSASLRYLFLLTTRNVLAEITGLEVEEQDSSGLCKDDGCDFIGQMIIAGKKRILLFYTMTREAIEELMSLKSGKMEVKFEDEALLSEFNKFMRQVAKNCLSHPQGYGYTVPFMCSSFISEKNPVLEESELSIIAKRYTFGDGKLVLTTFLV